MAHLRVTPLSCFIIFVFSWEKCLLFSAFDAIILSRCSKKEGEKKKKNGQMKKRQKEEQMKIIFCFSFLRCPDVWNVWYRSVLGHPIRQNSLLSAFSHFLVFVSVHAQFMVSAAFQTLYSRFHEMIIASWKRRSVWIVNSSISCVPFPSSLRSSAFGVCAAPSLLLEVAFVSAQQKATLECGAPCHAPLSTACCPQPSSLNLPTLLQAWSS